MKLKGVDLVAAIEVRQKRWGPTGTDAKRKERRSSGNSSNRCCVRLQII